MTIPPVTVKPSTNFNPPAIAYGTIPPYEFEKSRVMSPPHSRRRLVLALVTATALMCLTMSMRGLFEFQPPWKPRMPDNDDDAAGGKRVPVELFVMSKCPDAVYCESIFAGVLAKVGPITALSTHYIATPDKHSPDGATCKHGVSECIGNIQQLCMRHEHPSSWFGYVACVNTDNDAIPSREQAVACAESLDASYPEKCVTGQRGATLLRKDAEYVQGKGVTASCTVQIAGKTVCVRDGGEWRDGGVVGNDESESVAVERLARLVCEAYGGDDVPAACQTLAA
ncbi:hypothetical protein PhCBS80983_g02356 [Powellomyces hirtus]|uniref:Gamma interferon inducible lysosomal thiol reductase GILT n=1 Tax=Powellomyces hirtus TaxID=109895 RepID=A0A507E705_9FUNG|nr:hypothetical protein PhCBS80983_g02356 [Powellomyces hirtus]